jgi:hypothetical protein
MLTETFMRASGRMTKLTERECTPTWTGRDMRETGSKISSMGMAWRSGLMEHRIRDFIRWARSMDMASSLGLMEALLLESFMTIIFMEGASMSGLMKECLMVSGRTTKWRGMELSHGRTGEDMWVNTSTI